MRSAFFSMVICTLLHNYITLSFPQSSILLVNNHSLKKNRSLITTDFKKQSENSYSDENIFKKAWNRIKKFLPTTSKVNFESAYQNPVPDPGFRFNIRLVEPNPRDKRHIITRIIRYVPDIQWETAESIVDSAVAEGVALLRVLNDLDDAKYIANMMRIADPPINVEIYDSKREEIIPL